MARAMCAGEPYGIPKYGCKEALAAITPQSVKRRYDELLRTARIEIVFTGCNREEAAAAKSVIEKALNPLAREWRELEITKPHPAEDKPLIEEAERLSVSQSKLVLGFASGLSPKSPELPAMRLMSAVLGGTPSSKLFLNVREKLSLCYYCAASFDIYKGILVVDCGVEEQNIEKAKAEILAQLDEVKNGSITDDEIRHALLSLQNAYATIGESDTSIENFYFGQLLCDSCSTPEAEQEKLGRVTKEQIVEAARLLRLDTVYLLTGTEANA